MSERLTVDAPPLPHGNSARCREREEEKTSCCVRSYVRDLHRTYPSNAVNKARKIESTAPRLGPGSRTPLPALCDGQGEREREKRAQDKQADTFCARRDATESCRVMSCHVGALSKQASCWSRVPAAPHESGWSQGQYRRSRRVASHDPNNSCHSSRSCGASASEAGPSCTVVLS